MVLYLCEWSHTELAYDGTVFPCTLSILKMLKTQLLEIDYHKNLHLLKSILIA